MDYGQMTGRVTLPAGKRIAVSIGVDFDAFSVWEGTYHVLGPGTMSRGEFGAVVGVPRLLELFDRNSIPATWCIPGHTIDTFTPACRDVKAAGHEIAAHGYAHESPAQAADRDNEKEMFQRSLDALSRLGVTPRGYRSPSWDISPHTLGLLEELGFEWDSSLMANDFLPYRPSTWSGGERYRYGEQEYSASAHTSGEPSPIVEIPVTWFLDDFPTQERVPRLNEGMNATEGVEARWRDTFDFAAERIEGGVFALTIHPQTSGRAHVLMMVERLIEHMTAAGAAFMTLGEVSDRTVFASP